MEQGGIPPRPGVVRLIKELHAAGLRLAIATTTTPENVEVLLRTTLRELPPGIHATGFPECPPGNSLATGAALAATHERAEAMPGTRVKDYGTARVGVTYTKTRWAIH